MQMAMAQRIKVIKIGGNVIDNAEALADFCEKFRRLAGPKVLVHGGGKEASRLEAALGLETKMIEGRRVTSAESLDVVTMVYAGLINKRIVARLQAIGVDAIGMSGADADIIKAVRRSPDPIDYGFVGDISPLDVRSDMFMKLLAMGLTPVVCAIMHDGDGQLLNCNADSVASAVARGLSSLSKVDLIYCFEKPGVLMDADDDNSVIGEIDSEKFESLKSAGVVSKGMIPKLQNALGALRGGVSEVYIKSARNLLEPTGTLLRL